MVNSIRTPREGTSATSKRIAQAVDNEDWQRFRVSLKGKSTQLKLYKLRQYFDDKVVNGKDSYDDVCIRVDNYLKALARGGQLEAGVSLEQAVACDWKLTIRK